MESPWPEFSDKNNSFIHAGPGKLFLSFRRWMFFWKLESYSLLAPLRFPLSSVGCEHWSFQPLVAQTVRNLPVIQETQVWSLGQEDPLEKEMATHYSILAWGIPWTEEPGGLQSVELQTVRHDWAPAPPESLGKGRSASFRKTRGGREGLQLKKCARVGLAGSSPICTHGNLQLVHRKQTRRKPESSNLETKVNSAGQLCFQRKEGSCLSKI